MGLTDEHLAAWATKLQDIASVSNSHLHKRFRMAPNGEIEVRVNSATVYRGRDMHEAIRLYNSHN